MPLVRALCFITVWVVLSCDSSPQGTDDGGVDAGAFDGGINTDGGVGGGTGGGSGGGGGGALGGGAGGGTGGGVGGGMGGGTGGGGGQDGGADAGQDAGVMRHLRGVVIPIQPATPDANFGFVLSHDSTDGVFINTDWEALERPDASFNWAFFDNATARAADAGKSVSLGVSLGTATPVFLYDAGVKSLTFVVDQPYAPDFCDALPIPVPWDSVYLARLKRLVTAMGDRYSAAPNVAAVKLAVIHKRTDEMKLPNGAGETITGLDGGLCVITDDVSAWRDAGYTRAKVRQAFFEVADIYAAAFPRQELQLMLSPSAFPPLDENGGMIPLTTFDRVLTDELVDGSRARYGARFVVQYNGLQAPRQNFDFYVRDAGRSAGGFGYQMAWFVTGDPTCRMNGKVSPCDAGAVLAQASDWAVDAGASYLEFYMADLKNPALSDIFTRAHQGLR